MSELVDEVNEDLRRQELEKFWKENGSWIIAGVILAVVFTAALTWWRQYSYDKNMKQTTQMMEVVKTADTEKILAFADHSDKDHAVVARFSAAAIYAKRKDTDKAVAIYNQIENTTGVDATYRDLARLLSAGQRLGSSDPAALHTDLAPLVKPGNAWRLSALELEALVYARENKMKEPAQDLAEITADPAAPEDMRMRASTLREFYVGATADDKKTDK